MAKKLTPEQILIKAEEAYLRAHGWRRVKGKLWTPGRRIAYVFETDKLYRDTALSTQKQASEFSSR